jgi:DNA polymerase I-like protein with 3'-5' exonuclease and polymerase domains
MLITKRNFDKALIEIKKSKVLGYDSETFCLPWWKSRPHLDAGIKPGIFSMQFAGEHTAPMYLDFHHDSDKLGDLHFTLLAREVFADPEILWFIANAKYDLHQAKNYDIDFAGNVHCTQAQSRVVDNTVEKMGLDALAKSCLGVSGKLDVKTAIAERKLFTLLDKYGTPVESQHYDRLTLEELVPYGLEDVKLAFDVGVWQVKQVLEIDCTIYSKIGETTRPISLEQNMRMEWDLTKALFHMERAGIKINRKYCEDAYNYDKTAYATCNEELKKIAVDNGFEASFNFGSGPQLKSLFDKMGFPYSYTEKGTASFDKESLEESESPVAKTILKSRYHYKRAHTYFENFLWMADTDDFLHADVQQNGTKQVRTSYWTPNLQNIPKRSDKKEANFPVRQAFIPRSPDHYMLSNDYDGIEYRLCLDYANETKPIESIVAGRDPHLELSDDMNLGNRDDAKNMQYRMQYGGGAPSIMSALKCDRETALKAKADYFAKRPRIASFLKAVEQRAKARGYVFTWAGRWLKYGYRDAWKAPNGVLSGGAGDVAKRSVIVGDKMFQGTKSFLTVFVHDELVGDVHKSELHLFQQLADEMGKVYPFKNIQLTASPAWSDKSWGQLVDGVPSS